MKFNSNVFFLLILLTACGMKNTQEQSNDVIEANKPEPIEFPKFNTQFKNKSVLKVTDEKDSDFKLDSIQYVNWTDKYTPFKFGNGRLYSAELYSVQPQLEKFAVLTLRTHGDHWFKLHLVTINEDLELVDKVLVSDDWADLLEQAGDTEIVGKQSMNSNMISENEYRRYDIRTNEIINYYTDSTTYEIDSIATKIELLNNGTFELTRLDSIRTIKYGGIE